MIKQTFTLFLGGVLTVLSCSSPIVNVEAVEQSVGRQMTDYPEGRLQDLYKSFFQDRFGPGHIISDRESALDLILSELEQLDGSASPLIEPCGWEGNYIRLGLSAVRDGLISAEALTDALMESAVPIPDDAIACWREEWKAILTVIEKHYPGIPDLQRDKQTLDSLLSVGQYSCHHSRAYNMAYHPHYRIIKKEIAEACLHLHALED